MESILNVISCGMISLSIIIGLLLINWKIALTSGMIISLSYILISLKTNPLLRKNSVKVAELILYKLKVYKSFFFYKRNNT